MNTPEPVVEPSAEEVPKTVNEIIPKPQSMAENKNKSTPILTDERGLLVGSTFGEQYHIAKVYAASGLVPKALSTPEKVLVAMQFARELGIPPVTAMRQICVINGMPSLWGELPLSLVLKSGLLEDINEETGIDESGNAVWARCSIKRKGLATPIIRIFTKEEAIKADLWGKDIWKKYPKRMLQMRARSHALKDGFGDVLMGAAIAEYDYNEIPDDSEKPINTDPASKLKEKFNGQVQSS